MAKCVFCGIVDGSLAADMLYEDDFCAVLRDINPAAPVHLLAITKKHYDDITKVEDSETIGRLIKTVISAAQKKEEVNDGFRIVINTGKEGGQTVPHLHVHLLAGKNLQWPPG